MAAPGDETGPQSTSILTGAASRDSLATTSQRSYLHQAASEKQSLLNDEFSQSLNETPYSHRTGQAINKDVRRRVIDADPNQGKICLISNSEGLAIRLCHVVDRSTSTKIVSVFRQRASDEADYLVQIKSLEYSWGLQRPFHVDTRYNFLFRTSCVLPETIISCSKIHTHFSQLQLP